MVSKETCIANSLGLHGRPANRFVKKANTYSCTVTIRKGEKEYNAKSIVKLLTAHIKFDEKIHIICDGPDENEALSTLISFVESGCGE